jgi:hypothetical protein
LISIKHPPEELLKKCFRTPQRHSKPVVGNMSGTQAVLVPLFSPRNGNDFNAFCLEKEKT